ncbi:Ribonuclease H [Abeliophyllum distichum]|uniref:Ribonuclease H n=1 Tax=Abeliophyllum distichum TaxID=126358 RepID=A0ABD1SRU9_9LAMI
MRASSSKLNKRKYCRYHQSAGYDTDDCQDLKGKIESLIRRGHLKEFLVRPTRGVELSPPHRNRVELLLPPPPQHGRGEIYMIVGGSQHLEVSRRQCRKLTKEANTSYQVLSNAIAKSGEEKFSFSKEDAFHVLQPYSDALVITMPFFGINIHRTLVDDGSSVNVLYLRTFKQVEIDARHVRPFVKHFQSDQLERKAKPVEELELIEVNPNHPERVPHIGKELNEPVKSQLMNFLKGNVDAFAGDQKTWRK